MELKIMFWNVGRDSKKNWSRLLNVIEEINPDILILAELGLSDMDFIQFSSGKVLNRFLNKDFKDKKVSIFIDKIYENNCSRGLRQSANKHIDFLTLIFSDEIKFNATFVCLHLRALFLDKEERNDNVSLYPLCGLG